MPGRLFVERELDLSFFGLTVNSREPGEGAHFWHTHSAIEELYLFLTGTGVMGLDDDVVPVGPGTAVRVDPGVWRTWRAASSSAEPLRWICIRGGDGPLSSTGDGPNATSTGRSQRPRAAVTNRLRRDEPATPCLATYPREPGSSSAGIQTTVHAPSGGNAKRVPDCPALRDDVWSVRTASVSVSDSRPGASGEAARTLAPLATNDNDNVADSTGCVGRFAASHADLGLCHQIDDVNHDAVRGLDDMQPERSGFGLRRHAAPPPRRRRRPR